jgi:hypothetical protein
VARNDLLGLVSLLYSLIQRLQHSRVHGGDNIHRRVQFFFRHPCFPCVRKAPLDSGITEAHHRHGKADKHFLAIGETGYGMGIPVESSKVGFVQCRCSFFNAWEWWSIGAIGL